MRALLPVLLLVALPVAAESTPFTDSTAFFNTLTLLGYTPRIEGYETYPLGTTSAFGGNLGALTYEFSGPTLDNLLISNNFNYFGAQSLQANQSTGDVFFNPGDTLTIYFPNAVLFAGIFINANASPAETFQLKSDEGVVKSSLAYNQDTFYFLGLIADTPFHFIEITSDVGGSSWNVDNLAWDAVPEPSTWVMMAFSLAGLAVLERRRRYNRVYAASNVRLVADSDSRAS